MKISRLSGMPIESMDHPEYQRRLTEGLEAIKAKYKDKDFSKLSQQDQAKFMKEFEEMKEDVRQDFEFERELDLDAILSKTKLKELVNRYGAIAFDRGSDDKRLRCFILDSKL